MKAVSRRAGAHFSDMLQTYGRIGISTEMLRYDVLDTSIFFIAGYWRQTRN